MITTVFTRLWPRKAASMMSNGKKGSTRMMSTNAHQDVSQQARIVACQEADAGSDEHCHQGGDDAHCQRHARAIDELAQ